MHKKILLFFAFFFLFSGLVFPQQFPFVQYTPKDGLVNSRVRKIFQDSKGRMYFLTYGGLSVYDGSRFRNYNSQNGLGEEMVNDIVELGEDSLLVATNAYKMHLLVNSQIKPFETDNKYVPIVNHFLKSDDGCLYASSEEGLVVLEESGFKRIPAPGKVTNRIPKFLGALIEYKNYLVFTTNDLKSNMGIYVCNKKTGELTDSNNHETIFAIDKDKKNRIWVSLNDRVCLLDTIALRYGKLKFANLPPAFEKAASFPTVSFVFDKNYVWINNNGKEIIRLGEDGSFLRIQGPIDESQAGLGHFFIDRENIVWICNEVSGVLKLVSTNLQILDKIPGLDIPVKISFVNYTHDTTWHVLENKTLARRIRSGTSTFKINIDPVYVLAQIRGKLFAGDAKSIYSAPVPGPSEKQINFRKLFTLKGLDALSSKYFLDVFGHLMISSRDSLMVFQNNKVVPILANPLLDLVEGIQLDSKNRLWIGTRYRALSIFKPLTDYEKFPFEPEHEFAAQMRDVSIRSMVIDKNDLVWVGTRNDGIVAYEFVGDSIRKKFHFQTQEGLTDNFVTSLGCDSMNRIIVGTQAGVDRISVNPNGNYRIENITKSNNLFGYVRQIWVESSGQAFALRNMGSVFSIAPTEFTASTYEPSLYIEEMKANGVVIAKPLPNMEFRHNQGNMSFSVAAPSFLNEKQVQYSYRLLSDVNNEWSEPSGNTAINFLNLAPGKYTLQIRSTFLSTPYTPKQITYTFTILPPWWKTWWIRTLAITSFIAVVTLVIRSYFKRKLEKEKIALEKQQAIEKERTRIATDMHDDLGAGLSRIKYLSETIRLKKRTDETIKDEVEKISSYSDEMVEKMGEIVWALNQKNDTLADLVAFTRSYASDYLVQHELDCYSEIKGVVPENSLNGETRRNIFLSVKESLHNIVKHARATKVELIFDLKKNICIIISDNGRGFDTTQLERKGNGLHNIKKRMREVNGDAEFLNKKGTTVVLTIPFS